MLVDFSPGSAMLAKTALSMGVKVILVALNDIRSNIEADASGFAPLNKGEKVQALKPNRLLLREARKGLVAAKLGLRNPANHSPSA